MRQPKWDDGTWRMDHRVAVVKDCATQRAWVAMTWSESVVVMTPQVMVRIEELALQDLASLRSWELRLSRPRGVDGSTPIALSVTSGLVELHWVAVDVVRVRTTPFVLGLDPATGTWTDRTARPVVLTSVQSTRDAMNEGLQELMRGAVPPKP